MIVKVRMLQLDGASRGHTKSNELTIKVFDPIILDEDGDADEINKINKDLKYLRFSATDEAI